MLVKCIAQFQNSHGVSERTPHKKSSSPIPFRQGNSSRNSLRFRKGESPWQKGNYVAKPEYRSPTLNRRKTPIGRSCSTASRPSVYTMQLLQ